MYYSYRTTDPYSSEYRASRDYRPSRDHRSKDYRSSKDYTRSGSRVYDCCAPPAPPPKDDEYDFLPTHGSYIYEARSRRKPDDCQCDCCPHTYQGVRRVSEGRPRRSSIYEHGPSYDYRGSHGRRRSSVHEREMPYDYQGSGGARRSSVYGHEPPRDHHSYDRESRSKGSRKSHAIEIRNETNGALFGDRNPRFRMECSRDTNTRDVLDFLVGDSKRHRVVVSWGDHVEEPLTHHHSWRDVRKYAKYLRLEEVKTKKGRKVKHVHWADQGF